MLRRASFLTAILFATAPLTASEAPAGFAIDWQGGPETNGVKRSLDAQIALVEALPISDDAMAFFRAQPIAVDRGEGTEIRAGPRGIFFGRRAVPRDNPVLLHELIHRWQLVRMLGGMENPDVLRFYRQAKDSGLYPANAYMLSNPFEFFAMTASTVLYGRAARPPFARANVKAKSPELYAFIVREFGLRGG